MANPLPQERFSKILKRAIALPLGLMGLLALILTLAVLNLLSATRLVAHSDQVIAEARGLVRLMVNMETGLRGYALTGKPGFLEPYTRSHGSIDSQFDTLLEQIKDNPQQTDHVSRVRATYEEWEPYASEVKASLDRQAEPKDIDWTKGKTLMDQMRSEVDQFTEAEVLLRDERSRSAQRATSLALIVSIGVTLLAGIIIAFLTRGQLRTVGQTYNQALARASEDKESERAARTTAERANRMKDEFLSNLSHELRTPLNAILGWADLLTIQPPGVDEVKQGIEVIQRNARLQTQMIDDLLDMSRIISGKIRLEVQRLDIATVVKEAIESVRPTADAKGVLLQSTLGTVDRQVAGDPARLQQIVWNLLSNAIKFTPKHGRVQVLLERVNSHIEITVADTGQGINPEFLPFVFDRFSQEDGSTARRYSGMGLGLAIVRQLVELHGGRVRAKSPGEGQGATFIVTLPLTPVHAERNEIERFHPSAPTSAPVEDERTVLKGLTILVVDDEPDARELIRRILAQCEANVVLAGSVREALEALDRERVDVLLSDIGMPESDGYELIRAVRGRPNGGQLPAVALTAYARSEDRRRALRAGFQMHVVKPVEPAELVTVVASVAGRQSV